MPSVIKTEGMTPSFFFYYYGKKIIGKKRMYEFISPYAIRTYFIWNNVKYSEMVIAARQNYLCNEKELPCLITSCFLILHLHHRRYPLLELVDFIRCSEFSRCVRDILLCEWLRSCTKNFVIFCNFKLKFVKHFPVKTALNMHIHLYILGLGD